jgi:hypothetical protein
MHFGRIISIGVLTITSLALAACGGASSSGKAAVPPKSGASAPGASPTARATRSANIICYQGIASGNLVTAAVITACNTTNTPTEHKCTSGPPVYEAYVPTGNYALLRLGYKPLVYDETSFFVSETQQLCGDSIPISETPPSKPLTSSQVRSIINAAIATTAPPPTASTTTTGG